jgi:teichuronic acid biosynthesis glycosyltransferase TuaG
MSQRKIKNKKVAIILPNYNSQKYIRSTIKSIINQSYKNWELIIVDDCSNIETKKVLSHFKKNKQIKIILLKKNRGAGFCRNLAIQKSSSEYLAFIDSDDLWGKNKLKEQINFMTINNFDFTYTNFKTFFDGKNEFKNIRPAKKFSFKNFVQDTSIATSTMIVKRDVAKGAKFANTKICEDYLFKCKILKKVKFAYCLDRYLTKYRIRNNSLQSNKLKNFYWVWKINKDFNKFSFVRNVVSLFFISLSSIKKYGLR